MRIHQLTFTRFLAAISIVIFHYGSGSFLFNNQYVSFLFKQANIGVSYFFVLSGFVMIIAYHKQQKIKYLNYIKNRFARIYPAYLLAILLVIAINLFKNINLFDLFLNVFLLQSWFPNKALTINLPGWSLSVEFFFYLLFPIVFNYIYKVINFKNTFISIILFWVLSQVLFHFLMNGDISISNFDKNYYSYHPIMHLNEFLIGNLGGFFFIKNYKKLKRNYLFLTLTILVLVSIILKINTPFNYHNGLLGIVFIFLIISISLSKDIVNKTFSKNIFIHLGEISYGIYIYQFPIWMIFSNYRMQKYFGLNINEDFTLSFFIRLFILILVSHLSYKYFETPIRHRIKNLF